MHDEGGRRPGEEREQGEERRRAAADIGPEQAVSGDLGERREQLRRRQRVPVGRLVGLRQPARMDQERRGGIGQHHREDRAPADRLRQPRADHRRHDRHDPQHQEDMREHARSGFAVQPVAHDGARDHLGRRRREALHQPRGHQHLDARRDRERGRGADIEAQREQEHRTAAEPVRQGPVDQLARRHAEDEQAEAELDRGEIRAEVRRHLLRRRQGDVYRQRIEPDDRPEEKGEENPLPRGHAATPISARKMSANSLSFASPTPWIPANATRSCGRFRAISVSERSEKTV